MWQAEITDMQAGYPASLLKYYFKKLVEGGFQRLRGFLAEKSHCAYVWF